jgi:hypothetical protein
MRGRGPVLLALVLGGLLAAGLWWWLRPPVGVAAPEALDASEAVEGEAAPGFALAGRAGTPPTAKPAPRRRPLPVPDGPSLRGRVVDGTGRGIAGARVFAIPDTAGKTPLPDEIAAEGGIGAENFTDDAGRFEVAATGGAPFFSLVAEADGYAPESVSDVRTGTDTTIVLGQGHTIVGRVLTLEGEPVAGAKVKACGLADLVRIEREVLTGEDGRYRIERLPGLRSSTGPRMNYACVQVTKEGFAPLYYPDWGRGTPGRTDETTLNLILVRGATLLGKVVDEETGTGIEDARVLLWSIEAMMGSTRTSGTHMSNPWSPRPLAETRSGPEGAFRFEHVPANGFHKVSTNNSGRRGMTLGHVGAWKEGWTWTTDEVPVASDGATLTAEVRLRPSASLAGRIVDGEGRPIAKARVSAMLDDGKQRSTWVPEFLRGQFPDSFPTTGEDGRYRLPGVPASARVAARVKVTAWEPVSPLAEYHRQPTTESAVVDARAGEETAVPDIVLSAAATEGVVEVVVVVADTTGAPVWGAEVASASWEFFFRSPGRTDKEGRVRMPVPQGGRGQPPPAAVVRAKGHARALLTWPTAPSAGQEIRVVLGPARRVAGRVLNADGTPTSGGNVTAHDGAITLSELLPKSSGPGVPMAATPRDPAQNPYGWTTVGPDGAFFMSDLPDGPYHLIAYAGTWRFGSASPPATASGIASDSTDVVLTLPPGAPPPGGRILVSVADAVTGRPVALAEVTATRRKGADETPAGPTILESGSRRIYVPSGAIDPPAERVTPGQFEVREARPGVYDIDVRAGGYTATRVEGVTVGGGDVQVPTVALTRGVRLHGTARGPEGVNARDVKLHFQSLTKTPRGAGVEAEFSPDWRYDATGFTPGTYRVLVPGVGGGFNEKQLHLLRENDAPVVVPEGATDLEVDLLLVSAGTLRVFVYDARLPTSPLYPGPRSTDAQVAFGRGSTFVIAAKDGREVARADSLENGLPPELAYLVVLPGSYVVTYTPPGGPAQTTTVDVAAGVTAQAKIGTPPERR